MPELPEVELAARSLRRWLVGRHVIAVSVLDAKLAGPETARQWAAALVGQECEGVQRRAKYLLAQFTGDHTLVAHLRMTGRFVHYPYLTEPPRSERLRLHLDDGTAVGFQDSRRFGRVAVYPTASVDDLPELASLLMDQRLIGGLGNICAIEILYRAGIPPDLPAGELTETELARITAAMPPYLEWAIDRQSRREVIYLGEPGAENVFSIYRRAGEPCPTCSTSIIRTVIAGRGTFHCPTCQPPRRTSDEPQRREAGSTLSRKSG
jgi:formamidopyrimidine-DNA glycosylase